MLRDIARQQVLKGPPRPLYMERYLDCGRQTHHCRKNCLVDERNYFNLIIMHTFSLLSLILACRLAAGHPGEDHAAELKARGEFLQNHVTNLDHCAQELEASGVTKRGIQRRLHMVNRLREKRGLEPQRDDKQSRDWGVMDASHASLFKTTASCVLAPEEMVGPYCKMPIALLFEETLIYRQR